MFHVGIFYYAVYEWVCRSSNFEFFVLWTTHCHTTATTYSKIIQITLRLRSNVIIWHSHSVNTEHWTAQISDSANAKWRKNFVFCVQCKWHGKLDKTQRPERDKQVPTNECDYKMRRNTCHRQCIIRRDIHFYAHCMRGIHNTKEPRLRRQHRRDCIGTRCNGYDELEH